MEDDLKNITIMDYSDRNLCLWVRFFSMRFKGKQVSKLGKTFRFAAYEYDYDKTLSAAQLLRDEQLALNPQLVNPYRNRKRCYRTKPYASNKSGVVGVHHRWKPNDQGEPAYPHYTATWMYTTAAGKRVNGRKAFHYDAGDDIGEKGALKLATEHRRLMEKTHYVKTF